MLPKVGGGGRAGELCNQKIRLSILFFPNFSVLHHKRHRRRSSMCAESISKAVLLLWYFKIGNKPSQFLSLNPPSLRSLSLSQAHNFTLLADGFAASRKCNSLRHRSGSIARSHPVLLNSVNYLLLLHSRLMQTFANPSGKCCDLWK